MHLDVKKGYLKLGTGYTLLTRTLVMERNMIINNSAWKTLIYSLI
jgi:hypothetical protein